MTLFVVSLLSLWSLCLAGDDKELINMVRVKYEEGVGMVEHALPPFELPSFEHLSKDKHQMPFKSLTIEDWVGRESTVVEDMLENQKQSTEFDDILNRIEHRRNRFGMAHTSGEHPCFSGWASLTAAGGRCANFQRTFTTNQQETWNFFSNPTTIVLTNPDIIPHVNLWKESTVATSSLNRVANAINIMANTNGLSNLQVNSPVGGSSGSWFESQCNLLGPFPMEYTCSDHMNIAVIKCGIVNAFVPNTVKSSQFPNPPTSSEAGIGQYFFVCEEILPYLPTDPLIALVNVHEMHHVQQLGYGDSMQVLAEGAATLVEGYLSNNPIRPMSFLAQSIDWEESMRSGLLSTGFYSRFYNTNQLFLLFLSGNSNFGWELTRDVMLHATYGLNPALYGREVYDWLCSQGDSTSPNAVVSMADTTCTLDLMAQFRVALAASCVQYKYRPAQPYAFPSNIIRPIWDCSALDTVFAHESLAASGDVSVGYGGAHVTRIVSPTDFTMSYTPGDLRTFVIAQYPAQQATVTEITSATPVVYDGLLEQAIVVQVNADATLEYLEEGLPTGFPWQVSSYLAYQGQSITTARSGLLYSNNLATTVYTPRMTLSSQASLIVYLRFDTETSFDFIQVFVSLDEGEFVLPVHAIDDSTTLDLALDYQNGKITGNSNGWHKYQFNLVDLYVEGVDPTTIPDTPGGFGVIFISDSSLGEVGGGAWIDSVSVLDANGNSVFFDGCDENSTMTQVRAANRGSVDSVTGVNVRVFPPSGRKTGSFGVDNTLLSAPWNASWTRSDPGSSYQKTYLGSSYITNKRMLDMGWSTRVVTQLTAPFDGHLQSITLFGARAKQSVSGLYLCVINSTYHRIACAEEPSPNAYFDDGAHEFDMGAMGPLNFTAGATIMLEMSLVVEQGVSTDLAYLEVPLSTCTNCNTFYLNNAGAFGHTSNETLPLRVLFDASPFVYDPDPVTATSGAFLPSPILAVLAAAFVALRL